MGIYKIIKNYRIQRKAEKLFDIAWDRTMDMFDHTIFDFQDKLDILDPFYNLKCRKYFELILDKNLDVVFAKEKFWIIYEEIEYVGKTFIAKKKPEIEAFYFN